MTTAIVRAAIVALFLGLCAGASAAPTASAPPRLPELPRVPSLELGVPRAEDLAEVDRILERITSGDSAEREAAQREILELSPRLVVAMRRRLASIADDANRNAMKILLYDVRRAAREDVKDAADEQDDEKDKKDGPDYLELLVARPRKPEAAYRDLTRVLALSRMLEHAGTVEAVRGIIEVHVRFGEFLRVDTQRALSRLGDRAVPALLEARRHPTERIAKWAARRLDALGRAAPGQAAQIGDVEVLANVLRAYGRTKDLDAARIVVSFAGSERTQLREAARQAVAMLAETGHWQLRDAYENVVGKRAARDWSWERTARELFGELDRLRRAEILDAFESGLKARAGGDLEAMRQAFDQVLARSPDFERADEMADGYLAYAKQHADDRSDRALLALRRAERITKDEAAKKAIQSLLFTLEAGRRGERGIADKSLLRRAVELDPNNARAREGILELSRVTPPSDRRTRYAIAAAIGLSALLGIVVILLRPRAPLARDPSENEKAR
ncbi:MAG TPA: hypothetical protein VF103_12035 [Polyangiaceae bacterium]